MSPDTEDPELKDESEEGKKKEEEEGNGTSAGNVARVSTRQWAEESGHDPEKLFTKLFDDDISYLLSMDKLWSKRTKPKPLKWKEILETVESKNGDSSNGGIRDQVVWSIKKCAEVFQESVKQLKEKAEVNGMLKILKDFYPLKLLLF